MTLLLTQLLFSGFVGLFLELEVLTGLGGWCCNGFTGHGWMTSARLPLLSLLLMRLACVAFGSTSVCVVFVKHTSVYSALTPELQKWETDGAEAIPGPGCPGPRPDPLRRGEQGCPEASTAEGSEGGNGRGPRCQS